MPSSKTDVLQHEEVSSRRSQRSLEYAAAGGKKTKSSTASTLTSVTSLSTASTASQKPIAEQKSTELVHIAEAGAVSATVLEEIETESSTFIEAAKEHANAALINEATPSTPPKSVKKVTSESDRLTRSQAKPLDKTVASSISAVPYREGDRTALIMFDESDEEDGSDGSDQCDDVTDGLAAGSGDWRCAE
ncbi:MAG: hypothetical protein Q9164_003751 [Protoblastenia rupestris]